MVAINTCRPRLGWATYTPFHHPPHPRLHFPLSPDPRSPRWPSFAHPASAFPCVCVCVCVCDTYERRQLVRLIDVPLGAPGRSFQMYVTQDYISTSLLKYGIFAPIFTTLVHDVTYRGCRHRPR